MVSTLRASLRKREISELRRHWSLLDWVGLEIANLINFPVGNNNVSPWPDHWF